MRILDFAASARIALCQIGLAPLALRETRSRRAQPRAAETKRVRRRRGRFALVVAAFVLGGAAFAFSPPRHGAVLVVLPPWVDAIEAERRITAAGGLALSAEDGDVELFGLRLARMAIGADPEFARAAFDEGALVLDAGPILWLDDKIASVAAFFGRA